MDNFTFGLYIFAVGMVTLFVALALLVLMIRLLDRLFSAEKEPAGGFSMQDEIITEVAKVDTSPEEIEKLAVAMAVAIALVDQQDEPEWHSGLGELLEGPAGRYWNA
ncbi:MAG: OadG family protein [Anaerolineales bacterium]|nr:OadG family protein [Anaerolineales bacterium]